MQANLPQLLRSETGDTTAFDVEPQGASIYVHGQPRPADPQVRGLERSLGRITGANPHSGNPNEPIVNYQAGATEQRILHLETADPLRTPTVTVFPKPDYFFDAASPACGTSSNPAADCVRVNPAFAWNHGYYSPDIDITWSSFAGPGVGARGVDGPQPIDSPEVKDPNGGGLVPAFSTKGTWTDETDVRPTLLHLAGLSDDYVLDGRVITEVSNGDGRLQQTAELGACYKQLNASVGRFGTDTLVASTAALASGSASQDGRFTATDAALAALGGKRDRTATAIKNDLDRIEFHGGGVDRRALGTELASCRGLLADAAALAAAG